MSRARIGLSVPPQLPPADLPAYARRAESAGFDELWLAEDCFFAGGIAAVSAALSSTHRLVVGLGIMPAVARNAAMMRPDPAGSHHPASPPAAAAAARSQARGLTSSYWPVKPGYVAKAAHGSPGARSRGRQARAAAS